MLGLNEQVKDIPRSQNIQALLRVPHPFFSLEENDTQQRI